MKQSFVLPRFLSDSFLGVSRMRRLYRRFLAWLDRRFPVYTHCVVCKKPLPRPSHLGVCSRCNSDALRQW